MNMKKNTTIRKNTSTRRKSAAESGGGKELDPGESERWPLKKIQK